MIGRDTGTVCALCYARVRKGERKVYCENSQSDAGIHSLRPTALK